MFQGSRGKHDPPGLLLAITFSACVAIPGALEADAAQNRAHDGTQGRRLDHDGNPGGRLRSGLRRLLVTGSEQALKLASEGAAKGEVQAETLLGRKLYSEGSGVRQDDAKAVEWFTKGPLAGDGARQ